METTNNSRAYLKLKHNWEAFFKFNIKEFYTECVKAQPYNDMKPGTSGLRKKTSHFCQEHYTEQYVQSVINSLKGKFTKGILIGGDGRAYMKTAIQKTISICSANQVPIIFVAKDGVLSTPAASYIIRKFELDGAFILTASHNPGGMNGDFGIKFNNDKGAPVDDYFNKDIFQHSLSIESYMKLMGNDKLAVGDEQLLIRNGSIQTTTNLHVVDAVEEYKEMLENLFLLNAHLAENILVDSFHGVMTHYVERILPQLGFKSEDHLHCDPDPEFKQLHPDPNLENGKLLQSLLKDKPDYIMGIAFDGDGDRNMVLGEKGFFVCPSDALAVLASNHKHISGLKEFKGIARSMPTAPAVDHYAKKFNIPVYETPTGWKHFCNLFEYNLISICGEESFGLGSSHIREKDGMWACFAWLSIIKARKLSVKQLVEEYWYEYGRDYFCRYDYEEVSENRASEYKVHITKLMETGALIGESSSTKRYSVEEFNQFDYLDPTNSDVTPNQGYRIVMSNGARVVIRESGTGSSGVTLRFYFNEHEKKDWSIEHAEEYLKELITFSLEITDLKKHIDREEPSVRT